MNKRITITFGLALLMLTACGAAAGDEPAADLPAEAAGAGIAAMVGQARVDDQGAVNVSVTPVGLPAADGSLTFEVSMNTHSVDLTMPLAELAGLTTDNGLSLPAAGWSGPQGGHHVSGLLTFAVTQEQLDQLDKAGSLTVTLRDVDAPERLFSWE